MKVLARSCLSVGIFRLDGRCFGDPSAVAIIGLQTMVVEPSGASGPLLWHPHSRTTLAVFIGSTAMVLVASVFAALDKGHFFLRVKLGGCGELWALLIPVGKMRRKAA